MLLADVFSIFSSVHGSKKGILNPTTSGPFPKLKRLFLDL